MKGISLEGFGARAWELEQLAPRGIDADLHARTDDVGTGGEFPPRAAGGDHTCVVASGVIGEGG
jgi:hypothetical protein